MSNLVDARAEYKSIFTADLFAQRVNNLSNALGSFPQKPEEVLKNTYDDLVKIQARVFSIFKVGSTKELQTKYRNAIETSSLINFSGEGLKDTFIEPAKRGYTDEELIDAVTQFLMITISQDEMVKEKISEGIVTNIIDIANTLHIGRGAKFKNPVKQNTGDFSVASIHSQVMDAINLKKITPALRNFLIKKMKELSGTNPQNIDISKIKVFLERESSDQGGIFFYTQGLTETQVKDKINSTNYKDSKKSKKELGKTNAQIIDYYVNNSGLTDARDLRILRGIFTEILNQKGTEFFIGRSITKITGLLGEVRALFFLRKLFPEESIVWRGGTYTGAKGTQPHQDLLFNALGQYNLGVQVKNSTQEVSEFYSQKIEFWAKNADTFIKDLDENVFIGQADPSWRNVFLNYFGTLHFNIPYIITGEGENRKAEVASAAEPTESGTLFNTNRERLEGELYLVNRLLSMFASSYLYANLDKTLQSTTDLNAIYLIGTSGILTAADIIQNIIESFNGGDYPLLISSKYKDRGSHNIVDTFNARKYFSQRKKNAKALTEGRKEALSKIKSEENAYNSKNILNDVTISATFIFPENLVRL